RYLRDAGGTIVSESPVGRLLRFGSFAFVEVRRPWEPPCREYVRVPATVATPEEGLAWTFGLTATEYARDREPGGRDLYSPREMGEAARGLLARLRRVDRKDPRVDRAAAEAAFARRFKSVDRGATQINWLTGRQAQSMRDDAFCEGH